VPALEHGESCSVDEQGGVFAPGLSIVTSDADLAIPRERSADFVELKSQRLLHAEQVRRMVADGLHHVRLPVRPAMRAVVGRAVPDVEREQPDRRILQSRLLRVDGDAEKEQ
jgi:hypothetical protein